MGNKVEEQIKNVMSAVFEIPVEQIKDDSSPDTIESWDSLKHMNLIISLEDEFTIEFTDREIRDDNNIKVEHGKPLVFGKDLNKGLVMGYGKFEIIEFEAGSTPDNVVVYDETNPFLIRMISDMRFPEHPVPMGIIKRVSKPSFEESISSQIESAKSKFPPNLEKLVSSGETWEVK